MRVLFCKIQCPSFVCFCKPSPHIYNSGALKLENTPNVASTIVSVSDNADQLSSEKKEDSLGEKQDQDENCLRSSLKKTPRPGTEITEVQKKKVQWLDLVGKELVEIREFESSEKEESENEAEENRSCFCIIL